MTKKTDAARRRWQRRTASTPTDEEAREKTGPDQVADALIDLVDRVGVEGATAKLTQLAKEMEAEEARGLAARWARHRAALSTPGAVVRVVAADVLAKADRERLYARVRERCEVERLAREDEPRAAWCLAADIALANELGLDVAQAKALRKASGWPS